MSASVTSPSPERPCHLPCVTFRHGILLHAVRRRPLPFWHVECSEKKIQYGKMYGEVLVDGFVVRAVVPVVILWRGGEPAQRAEGPADVGMDECCLERDHDHV